MTVNTLSLHNKTNIYKCQRVIWFSSNLCYNLQALYCQLISKLCLKRLRLMYRSYSKHLSVPINYIYILQIHVMHPIFWSLVALCNIYHSEEKFKIIRSNIGTAIILDCHVHRF